MKLTRITRRIAALTALVSVLFMQLAVAAYTCPGLVLQGDGVTTLAAPSATPQNPRPTDELSDQKQPALCYSHCIQDNQSIDKTGAATTPPPFAVGFVLLPPTLSTIQRPFFRSQSPHLQRATAPSLAIRNCCFRT